MSHPSTNLEARQDQQETTVLILAIIWFASAGGSAMLISWICG